MKKKTYIVTNEQGQFYTAAGNDTWSADATLAHKYQNPDEARAIANMKNAFVVPHSC